MTLARADRWRSSRFDHGRSRRRDELFVMISRAADHSLLWLAIAGVLALLGGRQGGRAATRGLVAIALASPVVNGPLKLLTHRARPPRRRRPLVRQPRSSSLPSGHSASAFAFATAASRELPALAPALLPLAGMVAYSRVYVGVHYASDVLLGGALGTVAGVSAGPAARRLGLLGDPTPPAPGARQHLPSDVILVTSPHAGGSAGLDRARRALARLGLSVAEELEVEHIDRLRELLEAAHDGPRLVVAAGGDGTVGAVADCLADTEHVLGVLPLGTSNDFARSLGIPVHPERAAALFTQGKIATIDLGRLIVPDQPVRHFVHAATVGLNVNFARLATRASVREHLGRFTYAAAAISTLRERPTFDCELHYDGNTEHLTLSQLSVINAPTFGGALGMRVGGSSPDDRLLDVLAIESLPLHRIILAALFLLLHLKREVAGVGALHVSSLHVHTEHPLDVALDGEIIGNLPAHFEVAGEALRVITPQDFEDIDD